MRSNSSRESGFTLLEMLVVLVVLGLLVGLVVARGPQRSVTLEVRQAASQIAEALRLARTRAIAIDATVAVTLDVVAHTYRVEHSPVRQLPPGLNLSVTTVAGATAGNHLAAISFAGDGSSSGGHVLLAEGGHGAAIGVDWLTGRVSVVVGDAR